MAREPLYVEVFDRENQQRISVLRSFLFSTFIPVGSSLMCLSSLCSEFGQLLLLPVLRNCQPADGITTTSVVVIHS